MSKDRAGYDEISPLHPTRYDGLRADVAENRRAVLRTKLRLANVPECTISLAKRLLA